ncbi:methylamine utilization protein, partial [Ramlibacter alkalitolerans]
MASAVVTLTPLRRAAAVVPVDAVMDQVNSEFQPRVLVVTKGSRVRFPNSDTIRHQVYSFSAAKRFELPLYTGTPPEPVVFDRAGVVTLGCNIHDWMKGYVVILD